MAPTQIEADLQREYPGRRIAEFWRTVGPQQSGEMTPRELCVLVEGLSDESLFKREQVAAWSLREQLLATMANAIHGVRGDYRNAHDTDYEWAPVDMPESEAIRVRREAAELRTQSRGQLSRQVYEALLSGRLRMADIDVTIDIEEVLAAV